MSEKQTVSSSKKKMPAAVILCAVALTACVGIGAAFVLRDDKDDHIDPPNIGNSQGTQGTSTADTPSGVTYKVVVDNVEGDLQTSFEGAADTSTLWTGINNREPIMQAENGWYYIQHVYADNNSYDRIYYHDAATGEEVALCARPECTHNNEYCTAQNNKYQGVPLAYYEGYLYGISGDDYEEADSSKYKEPGVVAMGGCGDIALIRYAPDGTELTKMVSLQDAVPDSLENASFQVASIIGHKGALWIAVGFRREIGEVHAEEVDGSHFTLLENMGGYGLFHYDIRSEKLTAVVYQPLTEGLYASTPIQLQGVGDYVYFKKTNMTWSDPLNGDTVYRVNIRTGAVERVSKNVSPKYMVVGDKMLYLQEKQVNNEPANYQVRVMDLVTGESRFFLDEDEYVDDICCNEDYILIADEETLSVYDWDGNPVQTITSFPLQEPDMLLTLRIAVHKNTLYIDVIRNGTDHYYMTDLSAAMENGVDVTDWKALWENNIYE